MHVASVWRPPGRRGYMRFGILGQLLVCDGDAPIEVPAARQRVLLAALLVNAGKPMPAGALAELVWDGAPPAGAAVTLRSHVMRLRRVLGPGAGSRLVTRHAGYLIEAGSEEVDLLRFACLCREGGAALPPPGADAGNSGDHRDLRDGRGGQAEAAELTTNSAHVVRVWCNDRALSWPPRSAWYATTGKAGKHTASRPPRQARRMEVHAGCATARDLAAACLRRWPGCRPFSASTIPVYSSLTACRACALSS